MAKAAISEKERKRRLRQSIRATGKYPLTAAQLKRARVVTEQLQALKAAIPDELIDWEEHPDGRDFIDENTGQGINIKKSPNGKMQITTLKAKE